MVGMGSGNGVKVWCHVSSTQAVPVEGDTVLGQGEETAAGLATVPRARRLLQPVEEMRERCLQLGD